MSNVGVNSSTECALRAVKCMGTMTLSGVCFRCGMIADMEYTDDSRRFYVAANVSPARPIWTIKVTCPNCGKYSHGADVPAKIQTSESGER